jgi:hypothetical protein
MSKRNTPLKITVLATLLLLGVATGSQAEEEKKVEKKTGVQTITGALTITKKRNRVRSVTLGSKDGTVYQITLDAQGRLLGRQKNGMVVEATGRVLVKRRQKWLTVSSFKEVSEQKEEKEGKAEVGKKKAKEEKEVPEFDE